MTRFFLFRKDAMLRFESEIFGRIFSFLLQKSDFLLKIT
jgi:hypothetical protein